MTLQGTTVTVTAAELTASFADYTKTFASPISVDTAFYVGIIATGTDATNHFEIDCADTGTQTQLQFTGQWSLLDAAATSNIDLIFTYNGGSVYLSDADDTNRDDFDGFVTNTVSRDGSAIVVYSGLVSGFTGLTLGSIYYVQDAVGTIGTSAGSTSIQVGKALSTTQILIAK